MHTYEETSGFFFRVSCRELDLRLHSNWSLPRAQESNPPRSPVILFDCPPQPSFLSRNTIYPACLGMSTPQSPMHSHYCPVKIGFNNLQKARVVQEHSSRESTTTKYGWKTNRANGYKEIETVFFVLENFFVFPEYNQATSKQHNSGLSAGGNKMKFFIRYKYSRNGVSWTHASITINTTSDYMAEKIVKGRHPGCEVIILAMEER